MSYCIQEYLLQQKEKFLFNYSAINQDENVDAVHDMRVSLKKTQSLLVFLNKFFPENIHTKKDFRILRKIFKAYSDYRDTQVQIELLKNTVSLEESPLSEYHAYLRNKEKEQKALTEGIFEEVKTQKQWETLEQKILNIGDKLDKKQLRDYIKNFIALCIKEVKVINKNITNKELHYKRKTIKQGRYSLELLVLCGNASKKRAATIEKLKTIEDYLGNWHDRHIAGIWIDTYLYDEKNMADEQIRGLLNLKSHFISQGKQLSKKALVEIKNL
jgi:CHAD domain-containing protein